MWKIVSGKNYCSLKFANFAVWLSAVWNENWYGWTDVYCLFQIIDGHVVTINETTFSDGTDDSQTVFRVRTIDVKPEVQTTNTESGSESVTGTPANDNKEETTVPPRSVESFEDNDNEIPKNQVDTLTA